MPVTLLGKSHHSLRNFGSHVHDTWEIILNLEGRGEDKVGDNIYPFHPGSIICIPPNMSHSKTSEKRFMDIYIQSTEFIVSKKNEVMCFNDDEEKNIEMLMRLAFGAFHKKEQNNKRAVEALYDAMQYILLAKIKNPIKNPVVEQLMQIIVENFFDPEFNVGEHISNMPYCADYMRRIFRSEMGMTPVSYLNNLRLEHAKKLLKRQNVSGHTIGEIALMCGYYDPKYFSRLFKRHTGLSPIKYIESGEE